MFFRTNSDLDIPKKGARNAFGAFAYIVAIVTLLSSLEKFSSRPDVPGILAPLGFLSLLVLSATVMGTLIFGGPVMLYIDGKKKEAVKLLAWTVGSFAAITVCTFSVILLGSIR